MLNRWSNMQNPKTIFLAVVVGILFTVTGAFAFVDRANSHDGYRTATDDTVLAVTMPSVGLALGALDAYHAVNK